MRKKPERRETGIGQACPINSAQAPSQFAAVRGWEVNQRRPGEFSIDVPCLRVLLQRLQVAGEDCRISANERTAEGTCRA